jgi:alpha-N-arabinofuranosidase
MTETGGRHGDKPSSSVRPYEPVRCGKVLRAQVESETYDSSYYDPRGTEELSFPVPNVPYLKMSAVTGGSGGLSLFLLNRDLTQEMQVSLEARSFGRLAVGEALELRHGNLQATNTRDGRARETGAIEGGDIGSRPYPRDTDAGVMECDSFVRELTEG